MHANENVSEEDGIHNQGRLTRKEHPLAEAVKGLVGVKSVRALSKEVCATVCKLAKSDAASFVLLDGDRVYYADEEAPRAMWKGRYFPIGACISGWAATYQRSAVVEDVFEDARIPIEAYRPTGVRSMVMVPMMLDGEPMGSVGAYWHGVGKASDADLAAIETIGEAACRALEAAEMLDECQRLRTSWDGPGRDEVDAGLLPIVANDLRSPLAAIATGMSVLGGARPVHRHVLSSDGDDQLMRTQGAFLRDRPVPYDINRRFVRRNRMAEVDVSVIPLESSNGQGRAPQCVTL